LPSKVERAIRGRVVRRWEWPVNDPLWRYNGG
jgi:hypothetical protein